MSDTAYYNSDALCFVGVYFSLFMVSHFECHILTGGHNNNNNNNNNTYKTNRIQRMWNMKCFVIPVIIGTTGIVRKSLEKYLETIPG
jgi:hypothetical protein